MVVHPDRTLLKKAQIDHFQVKAAIREIAACVEPGATSLLVPTVWWPPDTLVGLVGFARFSVFFGCLARPNACFDTSWVTPMEQTLASSRVGHVIVGGSTGWPLKRPKLTIFK